MHLLEFIRATRAAVMLVVSAKGDAGPLLFAFRGNRLPFRKEEVNCKVEVLTYPTYLPRNAYVAVHPEGGGIDSTNVLNDRASLLPAWRSNIELPTRATDLQWLRSVLLVPRHRAFSREMQSNLRTSSSHERKDELLDVLAFSIFKGELDLTIANTLKPHKVWQLDTYNYCAIL